MIPVSNINSSDRYLILWKLLTVENSLPIPPNPNIPLFGWRQALEYLNVVHFTFQKKLLLHPSLLQIIHVLSSVMVSQKKISKYGSVHSFFLTYVKATHNNFSVLFSVWILYSASYNFEYLWFHFIAISHSWSAWTRRIVQRET